MASWGVVGCYTNEELTLAAPGSKSRGAAVISRRVSCRDAAPQYYITLIEGRVPIFRRIKCCLTPLQLKLGRPGASVIDTLVNSKVRLDSVKRMTQIQNTS